MYNLFQAEMFKIRYSPTFKISLLVATVCAFVLIYLSYGIGTGEVDASVGAGASGLSDVMIVSLLGSLLAGVILSNDFDNKTIHDALLSESRASVVGSKTLIFILAVVVLVLPYLVAGLIGYASGWHFAAFMPNVFIEMAAAGTGDDVSFGQTLSVGFVMLLVYVGRLSICLPVAFLVRRPMAVLGIGFVSAFVFDLLIGASEGIAVLEAIVGNTPWAMTRLVTLDAPVEDLVRASVVSVGTLVAMAALTYTIFRRAEVK